MRFIFTQKTAAHYGFQVDILPDQKDKNWLWLAHYLYTDYYAKGLKRKLC